MQQGPGSLLSLSQAEVLDGIYRASRGLGSDFAASGTLGCLPVKLAVTPAAAAAEEAGGAGQARASAARVPGTGARALEFPAGGEADLQALLEQCTPAAFGKGSETVVDESYRSALALPGARIYSQHLELTHLGGVLDAVRRMLLPSTARLSARLHALNVYRQGGFFKPHRDTPRGDPGFVASLVVCLPVAHEGGALRVEHGGRSMAFDWGAGATAGEVQWAFFFSDCVHEVLPVASGTRVTLAYEVFGHADTAAPPAPVRALSGGAAELARVLGAALDSNSFLVNGGKLGFGCKHAYPQSLLRGATEQGVRAMLKGADAEMLHVVEALGAAVSCKILRIWDVNIEDPGIWEMELWTPELSKAASSPSALLVSDLRYTTNLLKELRQNPMGRDYGESAEDFLQEHMGLRLDPSIHWLGGREAVGQWTLGTIAEFFGNESLESKECYCSLGIVLEVPPFDSRPTLGLLHWAGGAGAAWPAGAGGGGEAGPSAEAGGPSGGGGKGGKGKGKAKGKKRGRR